MISAETAQAEGWTPTGEGEDGSQTFAVLDDDGVTKNFGFDADGNFYWLPDTPPPDEQPPEIEPQLPFVPVFVAPPTIQFPVFNPPPAAPTPQPPAIQIPYIPPAPYVPPVSVTVTGGGEQTIDNDGDSGNTSPTMPTEIPQSLIDAAGWEVLWTTDSETGQIVTPPYYGRPPVAHNDIDAVGNEHLWETAWDGSGIYNFRWGRMNVYGNGTNQPTVTTPGGGGGGGGTVTTLPVDHSRPQIQVGSTAQNLPVFQVQDRDGVVKQWFVSNGSYTDLINAPNYGVMVHTAATDYAPPVVVDHSQPVRQVGVTGGGQPVLQVMDRDGVVKQWFVLNGAYTDLINVPTYGVLVHTAAIDYVPPANTGGNAGVSLQKPTIQVGTTRGGIPVLQLVDADGVVKQWFITPAGITDLVNAQNYGTLFHTAATDAAPTVAQPLSRPTIQIGTTAHGDPIKQLVDEAGVVKQWVVINGQTADLVNAQTYGVIFHTATTDQPLVDGTGGTTTHLPIPDTAGGGMSSSAALGLAAIAGIGLVLFLNRKKS